MKQDMIVVDITCAISDAFSAEDPLALLKVFTDVDDNDDLVKKARLFIAERLNCNFITEIETATEALVAYKKFPNKLEFTREMAAAMLKPIIL